MFALKYKWERDSNFSSAMARAAARLRKCDPKLTSTRRTLTLTLTLTLALTLTLTLNPNQVRP